MTEKEKIEWVKRGHIHLNLVNKRRIAFQLDLPEDLTRCEAGLLLLYLEKAKLAIIEGEE